MRNVRTDPPASVLIESMRDIGYRLETALADIIDNSITAGATSIHLLAEASGRPAYIAVLDDGEGMSEKQLLTAMRFGSQSPRDHRAQADLGRFGLGLKTASFSQCRRLTVLSRKDGITSAARWDIDHVVATNEWLVQIPEDFGAIPLQSELGERGTLVIWETLDRVIEQDGTARDAAQFAQRLDGAREHLELVFHRFLAGEPGLRKIRIVLNGRPLDAFDPFNRKNPATISEPIEKFKLGSEEVSIQPFTLPHHKKVDLAEWERYAGPGGYLRNQGFYVYRARRLIIHGTWFGIARQMELTKLTRVQIDISNGLDAAWKIDVLKASAQPPYQVRDRLRRIIDRMVGTSKRVYTARGHRLVSNEHLAMWNRSQDKNEVSYRVNPEHPVFSSFSESLSLDLQKGFLRVIEFIEATLPFDAFYADMGNEPVNARGAEVSDDALEHAVQTAYDLLKNSGQAHLMIVEMLRSAEPFRSSWSRTEQLLKTITENGEHNA